MTDADVVNVALMFLLVAVAAAAYDLGGKLRDWHDRRRDNRRLRRAINRYGVRTDLEEHVR